MLQGITGKWTWERLSPVKLFDGEEIIKARRFTPAGCFYLTLRENVIEINFRHSIESE